jgi:hypothetical protein
MAEALARGLVVVSPGARGHSSRSAEGVNTGKAPACIVDLKAAVRYLRHNDAVLPGSAERIISNGTSAGGAVSALLGATGNSPDYADDLKAIGAAEARDDIFAASCYCPITNLDHADAAYEWLFSGINEASGRGGKQSLTDEQIRISAELKALFPAYLNGLKLTHPVTGLPLALDDDGDGPFRQLVRSYVIASAQAAIDSGQSLAEAPWVTVTDGKVTDLDLPRHMVHATRMKTPPAFDSLTLSTPENRLFGTAQVDARHFTAYGRDHGSDPALAADPATVQKMNPMPFIGAEGVTTAHHWRIRHGAVDRDTSLAIPVILATRLANTGAEVDFAMPWGVGHSGDYDLDALFAWIQHITPPPAP